jgi:uncharacterized protein (DUF433 family)
MAILDWSQCDVVESVPGRVSGAWVFKGTRLPVATVIQNLEDSSVAEVVEHFHVTREQITAVLEFVAQSLEAGSGAALVEAMQAPPYKEIEREPATATGAVVLGALEARPYPDIDLTPPRVRLTNVRDVVL